MENSKEMLNEKVFHLDEVTVAETFSIVKPIGACRDMGTLRINNNPIIATEFENTLHPSLKKRYKFAESRIIQMRGYLDRLLNEDEPVSAISNLGDSEKLSNYAISKSLGLEQGYEYVVTRIESIVNNNIDPEIVPAAIQIYMTENNLPDIVTDVLQNDTVLLTKFTSLISSDNFLHEFYKVVDYDKEQKYPEDLTNAIDEVINRWVNDVAKTESDPNTLERTRQTLEDFFDTKRIYWKHQTQTGYNTIHDIRKRTCQAYFEDRGYSSHGGSYHLSDWKQNEWTGHTNIETVKKYAQSIERGKYLLSLYNKVSSLYQGYFPEIFVDADVKGLEIEDPVTPWDSNPIESCELSNGHWWDKTIRIKSGTIIKSTNTQDISNELEFHHAGPKVRRLIADIITMSHELSHGIYEALVLGQNVVTVDYQKTADHAVNEVRLR